MKIKPELLIAFMQKYKITSAILAKEIGIQETELQKLLNGDAVDEATARLFVYYFGADETAKMVDWAALGKRNPFEE